MIEKHAESHVDHNLTDAHLAFVLSQDPTDKGDPNSPVKVFTVEMPEDLAALPCGLYGPSCGDEPVMEVAVHYAVRGKRSGESRLVRAGYRPSNLVTIVAGPHDGHDWVLFTAYGGPEAPREVFEDDSDKAKDFWSKHALSAD